MSITEQMQRDADAADVGIMAIVMKESEVQAVGTWSQGPPSRNDGYDSAFAVVSFATESF